MGGKSTSATVPSRRTWKPSCPRPFLLRVISTVSHPTVSSCTEGTSGQRDALFTVQSGVDWRTPAQSLLEMKPNQTAQQREFSFRINAKLTGGWEISFSQRSQHLINYISCGLSEEMKWFSSQSMILLHNTIVKRRPICFYLLLRQKKQQKNPPKNRGKHR